MFSEDNTKEAAAVASHNHDHHQQSKLTTYDMNVNARPLAQVYLEKEKLFLPSFYDPPQHPHCRPPDDHVHPLTSQNRELLFGNDNSSVNRQIRIGRKWSRPDPIPGDPYAGVKWQKMGHALLGTCPNRPPSPIFEILTAISQ